MNPFVILLGGRDALLARETLVTCNVKVMRPPGRFSTGALIGDTVK